MRAAVVARRLAAVDRQPAGELERVGVLVVAAGAVAARRRLVELVGRQPQVEVDARVVGVHAKSITTIEEKLVSDWQCGTFYEQGLTSAETGDALVYTRRRDDKNCPY